jgi:hypothetical protein
MSMSKPYREAFIAYCHEHRPVGWALDTTCSSGSLHWYHFQKRSVYATPDWSEDGKVPVDVDTDDEGGGAPHLLTPREFDLPMTVSAVARAMLYLTQLQRYLDAMPDVYPEPLMASMHGNRYVKAHHHKRWYLLTSEGWCRPTDDSVNDVLERVHAELLGAVVHSA